MHQYFIKTPWLVKQIFNTYVWSIPTNENEVFLTFDDGPHPTITPWVLNELKKYNALATFFCIGKNVALYPDVYNQVIREEHSVGNHTYNHLNGWKSNQQEYINDISRAASLIPSSLFRPPYGKIKKNQARNVCTALKRKSSDIIMWDVLSADFDKNISNEDCLLNIIKNTTKGSIIVFHDSEKAFPHLKYVLPKTLKYLNEKGFLCKKIMEKAED